MFDNLLQLAADEDKATLTTMASKYPTLKEYFELGEKINPVRERLKTLHPSYENDFAAPVKELEDWRKFRQTDWPAWQTEHTRIEQALADATAQVAELENNRSAEVTPDEIKQIVKEALDAAGVVSTVNLEAAITKTINEKVGPTLDARVNGLTQRFEDVYAALTPKVRQHEKDFGDVLDVKAVFKHMKDTGQTEPLKAYDEMYAPKFAEKTATQIAADKAAEFAKGKAEGAKEALKAAGAARNPVDGKGSDAPRQGALMRRAHARMPKDKDGTLDSSKIPLGKGIARVATQEYFEKKAAAVQ